MEYLFFSILVVYAEKKKAVMNNYLRSTQIIIHFQNLQIDFT